MSYEYGRKRKKSIAKVKGRIMPIQIIRLLLGHDIKTRSLYFFFGNPAKGAAI